MGLVFVQYLVVGVELSEFDADLARLCEDAVARGPNPLLKVLFRSSLLCLSFSYGSTRDRCPGQFLRVGLNQAQPFPVFCEDQIKDMDRALDVANLLEPCRKLDFDTGNFVREGVEAVRIALLNGQLVVLEGELRIELVVAVVKGSSQGLGNIWRIFGELFGVEVVEVHVNGITGGAECSHEAGIRVSVGSRDYFCASQLT